MVYLFVPVMAAVIVVALMLSSVPPAPHGVRSM